MMVFQTIRRRPPFLGWQLLRGKLAVKLPGRTPRTLVNSEEVTDYQLKREQEQFMQHEAGYCGNSAWMGIESQQKDR